MKSLSADPDGVLLVDKAEGMTSHDVVALSRRKLGIKKIGHCGTLDPIATGLLLLTVGRGTKVQDLLMSEDKEYAGTFVLGVTTDTQDRQGEVIQQRPVPALDENQIRAAFEKFRGDFYQLPPMVSAKKHAGVPLYKLARQGKVVEREPRLVHVYRYTIDRIALPEIDFSVLCSKGFLCSHLRARHRRGPRLRRPFEIATPDKIRPVRRGQRDHGRSNQKRNARRNSPPDAEPAGSFQDARSVGTITKSEYRNPKQTRMTEARNNDEQAKLVVLNIRILNLLLVSNFEFRISDFI